MWNFKISPVSVFDLSLTAVRVGDAFPAGDLALRRIISEVYFDGCGVNDKQASAFAMKKWDKYSGLATTCIVGYLRKQRTENRLNKLINAR